MLSPEERHHRASLAAHTSWAMTSDRSARGRPGFDGLLHKFEEQIDPEGRLNREDRLSRAEHLLAAHMARLSLRAARARREARERSERER